MTMFLSFRFPIASPFFYWPPPCCAPSWALCSAKRSLRRCDWAICFCTQRVMQPVSRVERDLEVKSSMQDTKQWSTRFPKS